MSGDQTQTPVPLVLTALPAVDGDCLILTYGSKPRYHIVIDGGRLPTYPHLRDRMDTWASRGDRFVLLVVTHFDGDHIEGALEMVKDQGLPIIPEEIWFNGYDQVVGPGVMDAEDADELSEALKDRGWAVNQRFGGNRICISASGTLPTVDLEGGLEIVLLSPDDEALEALLYEWHEVRSEIELTSDDEEDGDLQSMGGISKLLPDPVDVAALSAVRSQQDAGSANRASIAFIARYADRSILFAADAHPDVIARSLKRMHHTGPLEIDIVKLSHHGSKKNNPSYLFDGMECRRYLISSNGRRQSHPDPETIARILTSRSGTACTFYFNYRQRWAELWNEAKLLEDHGHTCVFPNECGLTIDV